MSIPALPKIEGDVDIILDVYSHESLKGGNPMNEEYGDTDRLAEVGGRVLDATLSVHFFHKRPMLSADQLTYEIQSAISDAKLKEWFTAWSIKSKFRAAPGTCDILESPNDMRKFFKSYIGALYIRNGGGSVQSWISALVDPNADVNSYATPPPPMGLPPPLPHGTPTAPPAKNGSPMGNYLALLNQTASQKNLKVEYPAVRTGASHDPTWSVECLVSGRKLGEASAKSQKAAKEEAARKAYAASGWHLGA